MTSTASFKEKFNQAFSIFKWDLKSCSGTLVVYSILASVFTVIVLTLCLVIGLALGNENPSDKKEIFDTAVKVFQIISSILIYYLTAIFTIIYTIRVFSYLHNKRKADLYGALPISRVTLFLSKSAGAYIYSLVPAYFFLGIIALISMCLGQLPADETLSIYTNLIIGTLACVSAYGLLSICSGTTINAVIMFVAVCIVYPISAMFVKGVVSSFLVGSYSGIFHNHFVMNALNPLDAYNGYNVIYWLIFTVVCIVASAFLVRNRKAERAQSSFAYYLPAHIIKVLVSFLVGMFLGVLFGSLNTFGYGYFGFIFGFVLGSVPAFVISHLILYHGFEKLLKTSIPLGALIALTVVAMGLLDFDIIGYNSYVPNVDNVVSAGFIESSNCYYEADENLGSLSRKASVDYTDKEDITEIVTLHNQYLNEIGVKEYPSNEKFGNVWFNLFFGDVMSSLQDTYCFSYKLDNGVVSYRIYSGDILSSDFFGYSSSELDTSNITASENYFEKYSGLMNADVENYEALGVSGDIADAYDAEFEIIPNYEDVSDRDKLYAKKLVEAFKKDFKENPEDAEMALQLLSYDSYDIGSEAKEIDRGVCTISLRASNVKEDFSLIMALFAGEISSVCEVEEYYTVPKSYTNTIAVLKEMKILNDDLTFNKKSEYYNEYYYGDGYDSMIDYYNDEYVSDIIV